MNGKLLLNWALVCPNGDILVWWRRPEQVCKGCVLVQGDTYPGFPPMSWDKPGKQTQLVKDAEMSLLNAQFVNHCCKKLYSEKLTKETWVGPYLKKVVAFYNGTKLRCKVTSFNPIGIIIFLLIVIIKINKGAMLHARPRSQLGSRSPSRDRVTLEYPCI